MVVVTEAVAATTVLLLVEPQLEASQSDVFGMLICR